MPKKRQDLEKRKKVLPRHNEGTPSKPTNAQTLLAAHSVLGAPYQYIKNEEVREPATLGSLELYQSLQPKSAIESILASLLVGMSNATHDCLSQAARVPPERLQHRDLNLRYAMKGAAVVTQLADALERAQGKRPGNVSVGNVNVESGGQAIVGTVHSGNRSSGSDPSDGAN